MSAHPEPKWEASDGGFIVQLLGSFAVAHKGRVIDLPTDAQRLVAYLALRDERLPRAAVAGELWIDGSQDRAFGSLRSALWRLKRSALGLVHSDTQTLGLSDTTLVDLETLEQCADRACSPNQHAPPDGWDHRPFTRELLPGWYDEWAVVERERVHQRSLHALEALADRLCLDCFYANAIQAALAAIRLDPLRESAHRCLIRIHIAEGNLSEAIRAHDEYATLLRRELDIEPSPMLHDMMQLQRVR